MDCTQIRQRVLAGVPPGEEERTHAAGCPACAALLEDSGDTARSLAAFRDREPLRLPFSLDRLETALAEERGPRAMARSLSTPVRILAVLGATSLTAALMVFFNPRADLSFYPAARLWLGASLMLVATAFAVRLSLFPLHVPEPRRKVVIAALLSAFLIPAVLALLPEPQTGHPASLAGRAGDFLPRTLSCLSFGTLMGLPIWVAIRFLDRRSGAPLLPVALGAAAGALAGNLLLHLHCPITYPPHLLLGHALMGPLLVGAFYAIARVRAASREPEP